MHLRSTHHPSGLRVLKSRCWSLGLLALLAGCSSDLPTTRLPSVTELPADRDVLLLTADINNQGVNPSRLAFYSSDLQTGELARWLLQNDVEIEQPVRTQGLIENGPPVWLADGSGLIYQGLLDGKASPVLINPSGTVRQLELPAEVRTHLGRRAWSADGRWLAYERVRSSGEATFAEIYLLDLQTGNQRLWLANDDADREIRWLNWSPDSQRLAVARYRLRSDSVELVLLDLKQPPRTLIAEGEKLPFRNPDLALYDFQWLPDGQRISFLGNRTGAVLTKREDDPFEEFLSFQWLFPQRLTGQPRSAIWILDVRTRQFQELKIPLSFEPQGDLTAYTWSPDGQRLALMAGFAGPCRRLLSGNNLTCSDRVYLANANGLSLRQLTQVEQWPSYRLLWFSPKTRSATSPVANPVTSPAANSAN